MSEVVSSLMPPLLAGVRAKTRRSGDEPSASPAPDSALRTSSEARREDRHERIRHRAYELYLARGAVEGYDVADWLEAERQIDRER
jgi:Protein of unknown function (DUF2934)